MQPHIRMPGSRQFVTSSSLSHLGCSKRQKSKQPIVRLTTTTDPHMVRSEIESRTPKYVNSCIRQIAGHVRKTTTRRRQHARSHVAEIRCVLVLVHQTIMLHSRSLGVVFLDDMLFGAIIFNLERPRLILICIHLGSTLPSPTHPSVTD